MPGRTPYLLSGVVYSRDGSTAAASATVTIIDGETGDRGTATTNTSGQWVYDLANLTNAYSDGDQIVIRAVNSAETYEVTYFTHVDTSLGAEAKDLTLLDITKRKGTELNIYKEHIEVKKATLGTSNTILIPPYHSDLYKSSSITIHNDSAYTLTTEVYVSNKKKPGKLGESSDWTQLGSDISTTTKTSDAYQWTGKYQWTCVLSKGATATDEDVYAQILAST